LLIEGGELINVRGAGIDPCAAPFARSGSGGGSLECTCTGIGGVCSVVPVIDGASGSDIGAGIPARFPAEITGAIDTAAP
jgi:hypothetical protein